MSWLGESAMAASGMHPAFQAPNRAAVDAFHFAAIAAGAVDIGGPGLRVEHHPNPLRRSCHRPSCEQRTGCADLKPFA